MAKEYRKEREVQREFQSLKATQDNQERKQVEAQEQLVYRVDTVKKTL